MGKSVENGPIVGKNGKIGIVPSHRVCFTGAPCASFIGKTDPDFSVWDFFFKCCQNLVKSAFWFD